MPILIQHATILAMDNVHGSTPFQGDVLIDGDSIRDIGTDLEVPAGTTMINGHGKLVMPGLVNAHLHSGEALFRGRYDNMPLEIWMLYTYPVLGTHKISERLIYLRSMLVAMESLRSGVTCITDDMFEAPQQTLAQLGAAVQAYDDIGIRATVSGHIGDKPYLDIIPFTREHMPQAIQDQLARLPPKEASDYIAFAKAAHQQFHDRSGRIRFMVAPSAPQRCTEELMLAANELAVEWEVPFHTHIVETKVQSCTGPEMYGRSLIQYMNDLSLLHRGVTIAHSIWVSDADIKLMGDAGVSVVHNVISNQKLGAGIAPIRKLLSAGVNVGLGTDGLASNDTANMFSVLKAAGLLHNIGGPDYDQWLSASEVLDAGTLSGARTARLDHLTGSIEVGKRADLLILDTNTLAFTPLNDICNQLVYCEDGRSIDTVIVNGDIVVEDGQCTRINAAELLAELRELMPEFLAYHRDVEKQNAVLEPYLRAIHQRCNNTDIGIHRLGTQSASWQS